MSTLTSYQLVANNIGRWQTITRSAPAVALQIKYYQANIGKVTSANALLKNDRLFGIAMQAFGLGDRLYAKGLMKQVLQQGISSSTALANTLNDPRIKAFAKAFNFAATGATTTQSAAVQTDVMARYVEQTLETTQGAANPGVQMALYFRQNAPNLKDTYGILADRTLLSVVQTALEISPLTSQENVDVQAKMIGARLNVADFQNPQKLQTFITRFCAMYDASNSGSGASGVSSPALSLFDAGGSTVSIGADALMTLQNLKVAGR